MIEELAEAVQDLELEAAEAGCLNDLDDLKQDFTE